MSGVFEQLHDALRDVEALDLQAWYDVGGHFTCGEFNAIHALLQALGLEHAAQAFLDGHVDVDEPDDEHYRDPYEPMAGELLAVTP